MTITNLRNSFLTVNEHAISLLPKGLMRINGKILESGFFSMAKSPLNLSRQDDGLNYEAIKKPKHGNDSC